MTTYQILDMLTDEFNKTAKNIENLCDKIKELQSFEEPDCKAILITGHELENNRYKLYSIANLITIYSKEV